MINKKIKVISVIILSSLALCACTDNKPVTSVNSSVTESVSSVTESTESVESVENVSDAADPELLLLEGLEYASIDNDYRIYNVNFDKMYSDTIDFENETIERFPAFVITKTDESGNETIVKKTIQKAYDKDTFLSTSEYIIDIYDMDKVYDNYLARRKDYIERGYEEKDITDAIMELTNNDAIYIETTLENALFQYMTLPGATTKGADFIMPMPYYPAMSIYVTDLGQDYYPEALIKEYDHVDVVVQKENWVDADVISGIRYIGPDEGILYDTTDEFEMSYYKMNENECVLDETIKYEGYHEDPETEGIFYVLKNDDGTETYLTPEEAHAPKYDLKKVEELDYNWLSFTPLNVIKLCEHLD